MAWHSVPKNGSASKFRMVVIDAELQEGGIGQLAQAIQGAFGGQRVTAVRLKGPATKSLLNPDSVEPSAELDGADVVEDVGVVDAEPPLPKPKAQRAPKKIRTPSLDTDLNPGADPSFKACADASNVTSATSVLTKFLIVAAWLHEERGRMNITADRAYTCFRFAKWPFNVDFEQPLGDLKSKSNYLELKPESKGKGEFSITHLGLDKATKMKASL